MKQTAVEWLLFELSKNGLLPNGIPSDIHKQAKGIERRQKAEEYLKGFKDGKEYQIKLDELTLKSE